MLQVLGVVENMSNLQVPLPSLRFINTNQDVVPGQSDITTAVLSALQHALVQVGVVQDLAQVAAVTRVFLPTGGGASHMCEEMGLQLLGSIPLDPLLGQAGEEGRAVAELTQNVAADRQGHTDGPPSKQQMRAPSADALQRIVRRIVQQVEGAAVPDR